MEKMDACSILELPAGFRFCPTDEEIIIHYLLNKVLDKHFGALAIGEADLNKTEPWDLPEMAKTGEKEWFFFWQRYRKYPTGMRTNRATESGYWKATGKDKNIYKPRKCLVGMKKTLVFYQGRAPKGHRTNWVMHEYRLEGDHFSNYDISRAAKEEWVVCRVFHKNTIIKPSPGVDEEPARMDPLLNSPTLPSLRDYDQEDEFKPNISSSVSMMLENNKLQKTPHDQINLPLPYQSPNVDPNPGYSIVSRFDGEYFTESTKTFHEQLDDEGLYFDSLWSYWETDCM